MSRRRFLRMGLGLVAGVSLASGAGTLALSHLDDSKKQRAFEGAAASLAEISGSENPPVGAGPPTRR